MSNQEKLSNYLINNQEIAATIFIIALLIMIYLLNEKKESNITHVSNPNTKKTALFNKSLVIAIYLYFLYISYTAYKNSNTKADQIGLISAIIAVIPPIIMVYAYLVAAHEENVLNPLL